MSQLIKYARILGADTILIASGFTLFLIGLFFKKGGTEHEVLFIGYCVLTISGLVITAVNLVRAHRRRKAGRKHLVFFEKQVFAVMQQVEEALMAGEMHKLQGLSEQLTLAANRYNREAEAHGLKSRLHVVMKRMEDKARPAGDDDEDEDEN